PAPGKRPYHTIIPAIATHADDDSLFACLGVMGGFMQPQGHTQMMVALVDDGLDPQAALDRPRYYLSGGDPLGQVALEAGIPADTMSRLEAMGHNVKGVSGFGRSVFGKGHVILRNRDSGVLWGGSDPRGDGCAMSI
ncbi:MAG: gamma-glutamyltransferase, partial [Candidatus Promineifilaceae bacterium]